MRRVHTVAAIGLVVFAAALSVRRVSAADNWLEMQSAHFKALSNAGEGATRNVLWQFEQIRSAMAALWPWMNPLFADAHARLAEVRAALGQPASEVMPAITRAVELEPSSVWHRLTAARVLWRFNNLADAHKAAQVALTLARTDQERAEAQRLISSMPPPK